MCRFAKHLETPVFYFAFSFDKFPTCRSGVNWSSTNLDDCDKRVAKIHVYCGYNILLKLCFK